jgi:WD40 repeat protein
MEARLVTQTEIDNPYVGPRPFSTRDSGRFFGREREARDLIPLVISERLVLFYAQSGAGKSSLINARLIPGLQERNFTVLPVGRVSGQASGEVEVENIFIYNLLVSLEQGAGQTPEAARRLADMSLADYLANLELEKPPAPEAAGPAGQAGPLLVDAPQVIGGVRPLAVIIDQFEELFTTHPEAWEQRGPFFEQLCHAMEVDPYLWVVLSIREDYVAALTPYTYLLPGRLRARFYMQRMGYAAALEAVKQPVAGLRPFEVGVAERLVSNLRLITAGESKNGQTMYVEGQYVEPVQLQVVCFQLWENLRGEPGSQITAEDLNRLARGDDLAQFVSRALADFYEQSLAHVLQDPSVRITERQLRDWFSNQLITEAETRGSVFQGEHVTGGMPNEVVRLLEAQFIVRSETRAAGKWYELSHDRFIGPILQANRAWLEHNPRPILVDAAAWTAAGKPKNRLYDGSQLSVAVKQLETDPDSLDELEREFIRAGQAEADRQRSRRQRIAYILMAALLVIFAALTTASLIGWNRARTNEALASQQKETADAARVLEAQQARTAEAASIIADQQRVVAEEQRVLAEDQRQTAVAVSADLAIQEKAAIDARATAEAASTIAVVERDQAEVARDQAEVARNQAHAGRLSSLADYFRTSKLDLSLLLAVDAVDLADFSDSRRSLFDSLQRGLVNSVSRDGFPVYLSEKAVSMAISQDGTRLAVGLADGSVQLYDTASRGRVGQVPEEFRPNIEVPAYSVAFSPDGAILAQGNGQGQVLLWSLESSDVSSLFPLPFPGVLSISFQPGGELLAIATRFYEVTGQSAVILYNYKQGSVDQSLEGLALNCGEADCSTLAWSPDGTKLAVGDSSGAIKVFDLDRKRVLMSVDKAHLTHVSGLAWYPDNQRLASSGLDNRLVQWNTATSQVLLEANQLETPLVRSLAISPDGRFLLAGHDQFKELDFTSLWDADTLTRLAYDLFQHKQTVSAVAFTPQGNRFVTASGDESLVVWNFAPINPLSVVLGSYPEGRLEGIVQDGSGELAFAQFAAGNIHMIKTDGQPFQTFPAVRSSLATFLEAGRPAVTLGDFDGNVSLVDAATGETLGPPFKLANGKLQSLAVSPDGQQIAAAACRGENVCDQILVHNRQSEELIELKLDPALDLGLVSALAFSPDGQTLGMGTAMGRILFYDLQTGEVRQAVTEGLNLKNLTLVINSLAFGPSGSDLVAAGFHTGRVALWQVSTRDPIGQFAESANGEVTALSFRKDTGTGWLKLVAATNLGEMREFEVDVRAWQQRACAVAGNRDMTQEEKSKFRVDGDLTRVTCPR